MAGMAESRITQRGQSHLKFCQALGGSRFVKDLDKSFVTFALETAAWLSKHMRTYIWPSAREVRHNVAIWNQAKPEDKLPTSTLWERTKPSMYVVFNLQRKIIRMTSIQIQLHSRKKDNAGPPWVRRHSKNIKMQLTSAYHVPTLGKFKGSS